MQRLVEQKCKPCEGGVPPLPMQEARKLLESLDPAWHMNEDTQDIRRSVEFAGFARTMAFVNAVAWVATVEGHHPHLRVDYGRCEVRYRTTAIDGLSLNDFICAAKIDRLLEDM